jgi:1-acyl-sn-glycerol-3-phosphate acyltransferase
MMKKKNFPLALQQQQKHTPSKFPVTRPITKKRSDGLFTHAPIEKAFYGKALYQIGRTFLSGYARLMLDVDIQHQAPMSEGPKILVANHPTTTDPFFLLPLISDYVSFLVTGAAFNIPGVGSVLRATGQIPAVRGSGGATIEAAVRQLRAESSIAIFPEGALSPLSGGLHQPHSGAARVALLSGAPVIPIGIGLQRERIRVIQANIEGEKATGHFYLSGHYAVTVGQPLCFEGDVMNYQYVNAVSNHILQQIKTLADQSDERIRSKNFVKSGSRFGTAWSVVPVRKSQ